MNTTLIQFHNSVVGSGDTVIHAGDFCFSKKIADASKYIKQLNGTHVFLKGSHDYWLKDAHEIWEKKVNENYVVACHYAMRVWPRSHFNSWQVYGHSHGKLEPSGKQWDVGVDNNNFLPVSFDQLEAIMKGQPDNFNRIFPKKELKPVSGKFYNSLEDSIEKAAASEARSFEYEGKYVIGDLTYDGSKIIELYEILWRYKYLKRIGSKFKYGLPDDAEVSVDVVEETLDFLTVNSHIGAILQKFLTECFIHERAPSIGEWTKAIKVIVNG
ncbi:MAG: hypothetical protein KAH31_05225 [Candidatus Sabulitectum sp.]|nr:hypothetical protein [Candidatus Sabulitectum sp.]